MRARASLVRRVEDWRAGSGMPHVCFGGFASLVFNDICNDTETDVQLHMLKTMTSNQEFVVLMQRFSAVLVTSHGEISRPLR